jgi:hypothetical protein
LDWVVPKSARPDDPALFHLPGYGFMARGVIDSEPKNIGPGRYASFVRDVAALPVSVPIAFILENHKAWKWPTHPLRDRTSIDGKIQFRLEQLLDDYQAALAGEDWKTEPLLEGASRSILVTAYERILLLDESASGIMERHAPCATFRLVRSMAKLPKVSSTSTT